MSAVALTYGAVAVLLDFEMKSSELLMFKTWPLYHLVRQILWLAFLIYVNLLCFSGSMSDFIYQDQDCTSISLSAPFSSVSTDSRSKSPLPLREVNRNIKANHGQGSKSPHLFASPRRSPRLLVVL